MVTVAAIKSLAYPTTVDKTVKGAHVSFKSARCMRAHLTQTFDVAVCFDWLVITSNSNLATSCFPPGFCPSDWL